MTPLKTPKAPKSVKGYGIFTPNGRVLIVEMGRVSLWYHAYQMTLISPQNLKKKGYRLSRVTITPDA